MKKFLITGGDGRFAKQLKEKIKSKNFIFLNKKQLNILNRKQIEKKIKKYKPYAIIHLAGLSRPMIIHEKNIKKSIELNIIGTSNLVIECSKLNVKIIYFSSQYVYPGSKGNYKENSPVLPMNNYAWSKLGGESAVNMYKNSLILRVAMSEKPWKYNQVYKNVFSNYLYHDEVIKIFPKLLNKKGIINLGSNDKSIVNFAKKTNKNIQIVKFKQPKNLPTVPIDSSININKLKKILKK